MLWLAGCGPLVVLRARDATLTPTGREIVAFIPPDSGRQEDHLRHSQTVSRLRRTLSHLEGCSDLPSEAMKLIVVERVVVVRGLKRDEFDVPERVGILLLDGDRDPELVDPGDDIRGLPRLLATRAAAYFDAPACAPPPRRQPAAS